MATPSNHEQVALLAYQIWQSGGCKPGTELQNWFEAEKRIKATAQPTPSTTKTPAPSPTPSAAPRTPKTQNSRRGGNGRIQTAALWAWG